MAEGIPEDLQRWTSKRRVPLVLSILKGETSIGEAARKHDLKVLEIEDWKERFLLGAENALRSARAKMTRSRMSRSSGSSRRSERSSSISTS
jgi:hypothetical protein